MRKTDARVIVLGGGVTGLSTAYHLAKKGFSNITVLDKGPIGDGSSSRAGGIITGLLWSETGVKARQKSLQLFRELSDELEGYAFQAAGTLNVYSPQDWAAREQLLPLYDRCEAPYEVLNADEMRKRWPQLKPQDEYIGLFDPTAGYSEPDEYIPALAKRCRELGVAILEHQPVTDMIVSGGQITGIRTATGSFEADAVVSTVYSWTNTLLAQVGVTLPVKTVVHQRYVTEPLHDALTIPAVNIDLLGGYLRPAAGKRLLIGIETAEREEFRVSDRQFHLDELKQSDDPLYTAEALKENIRANFTSYIPSLAAVKWEDDRVGLLTFSMDGEPIIGPIKQIPGLYVGVAFHSGGFAYNPVSGLLLAEYVADGQTSMDITAFSADRFTQSETDDYLAETVQQKNVARRRH